MPSYFSGANCFVKVGAQPILEVAGVSYQEIDSQTPIYGYSSRYFDAVAPGQKIIKGNLVINFVRPDYLAFAIARGKDAAKSGMAKVTRIAHDGTSATSGGPLDDTEQKLKNKWMRAAKQKFKSEDTTRTDDDWNKLSPDEKNMLAYNEGMNDITSVSFSRNASSIISEAKAIFNDENLVEDQNSQLMTALISPTKDVTAQVAINIDIVIGNQYVIRLLDCYITSRGSVIQIDESTLVEEYSFFARNLKTLTINT